MNLALILIDQVDVVKLRIKIAHYVVEVAFSAPPGHRALALLNIPKRFHLAKFKEFLILEDYFRFGLACDKNDLCLEVKEDK